MRRIAPARGSLLCLGIVGTLIVAGRGGAQTPSADTRPWPGRLSVRPHAMATGTETVQVGEQRLDSIPDYLVYVPTQCVGTRRMPLVVILHGGGGTSREQMDRHREFADKYGMILLVPNSVTAGLWDISAAFVKDQLQFDTSVTGLVREFPKDFSAPDVKNIDAALKQVLRKFAIDPDKIALAGMSDGASYSLFLGRSNLDVFSLIAPLSPGIPFVGTGPQNNATQFLLSGGIAEPPFLLGSLIAARQLQEDGHVVERVLVLRGHEQRAEDYAFMWHWLNERWADRSIAVQAALPAWGDSVPLLTTEVVTKMTTFWTSFMKEPDSILTTARKATQKQITVAVGPRQMWLLMADIPTLAAKYSSVAGDLKGAGLSAEQAEAYRIALISAQATKEVNPVKFLAEPSVLATNVAFLNANPKALAGTGFWVTP